MEGAEPLGDDLNLLRIFYELGLRTISLTHARKNAAAAGGIFAATGSPTSGLTSFGRDARARSASASASCSTSRTLTRRALRKLSP